MRTERQEKELRNIFEAWRGLTPETADAVAKENLLTALKDIYRAISTTAVNKFTMEEGAKLIDLYADIQNVIIFLETGEDREFDVDFDIERIA